MFRTTFVQKILAIFVLASLYGSVLAPAATALAAGEGKARVIVDALNLREGPGLEYDILKMLARGQELTVLRSNGGDWTEVSLADGTVGWVYSPYILLDSGSEATVSVEGLNLRAGPGFNTRVLKILDLGQGLSVEGRSVDGTWLQVTIPGGTAGWVYRFFVDTDVDIISLPVKEASGGPHTGKPDAKPAYSILVTIENNQAEVELAGFPAEKRFSVALGLPGKDPDLVVGKGKTSAGGSAQVEFEMPEKWSGGAEIKENRLLVTVEAEDGSFTRSVNIQYYRW